MRVSLATQPTVQPPAVPGDVDPRALDELPRDKGKHPSWIPVPDHTPAYLRTSDQLLEQMRTLQERYPQLVDLIDIGDSARKVAGEGGHDIWMLRVTNRKANVSKKPVAMHVGGVHAREIANPELLLRWTEKVLERYGTDAQATSLLDTRELHIVPLANPDGHDVVTDGFADGINPDIWQRKNLGGAEGVDLNRNFRWHWGAGGTSRNPDSDVYRGPSAASEPETQALQGVMERSRPNMFVDWHSFSELNLYPWGDSFMKAPDHTPLKAISDRFSELNGYTSQPSVDLYPTSGTTTDHAYGVHRIPAFGVETGMAFHPMEAEFADIQRRNEPVIELATDLADAPYERVVGPRVPRVELAADGTITARATDTDQLRAAEWTTTPLAAPGTGTPMAAVDGAIDGTDELLTGTFEMPKKGPYKPVPKLVYVRAQDVEGHWGIATPQWITPPA